MKRYNGAVFKGKALLPALILIAAALLGSVAYLTFERRSMEGESFAISKSNSLASVLPGVIIALTNTDRVKNGSLLLVENPLLTKAAQIKADDMLARQYYSHTTPEGKTPLHFLELVGYKYLNAGENLDLTYVSTSEDVHTAWMNSPAHRANLLLPQYTEIGVGVAQGQYQGHQVTFVVELLATPLPPPPIPSALPTPVPPPPAKAVAAATSTKPRPKPFTPVIPVSSPPSVQTSLETFVSTSTDALAPILERVVSQAASSSLPLPTLIVSASSTESAVELLNEFKETQTSFRQSVISFLGDLKESAERLFSKLSSMLSRAKGINILAE